MECEMGGGTKSAAATPSVRVIRVGCRKAAAEERLRRAEGAIAGRVCGAREAERAKERVSSAGHGGAEVCQRRMPCEGVSAG